jgi:hypothetical protein
MTDWTTFPSRRIGPSTSLFRIHQEIFHPAWFNSDGSWRFDPLPAYRTRFGTCYLGLEPLSSYVEVFGRIRAVPETEIERRVLSMLAPVADLSIADLTNRTVLGDFGVTATHSTGGDYGPAQTLAVNLFDAGFDGILYRVRHDPAMELEAVALFGEPGETPTRLSPPKTGPIPPYLIDAGREFHIEVVPSIALP